MKQLGYTTPPPDLQDDIVLLIGNYSIYRLMPEQGNKWIFRDMNNPAYGSTGHWSRKDACVNSALEYGLILSFETEQEMLQYIKEHKKTK